MLDRLQARWAAFAATRPGKMLLCCWDRVWFLLVVFVPPAVMFAVLFYTKPAGVSDRELWSMLVKPAFALSALWIVMKVAPRLVLDILAELDRRLDIDFKRDVLGGIKGAPMALAEYFGKRIQAITLGMSIAIGLVLGLALL